MFMRFRLLSFIRPQFCRANLCPCKKDRSLRQLQRIHLNPEQAKAAIFYGAPPAIN
jgi:hypothetical protein